MKTKITEKMVRDTLAAVLRFTRVSKKWPRPQQYKTLNVSNKFVAYERAAKFCKDLYFKKLKHEY